VTYDGAGMQPPLLSLAEVERPRVHRWVKEYYNLPVRGCRSQYNRKLKLMPGRRADNRKKRSGDRLQEEKKAIRGDAVWEKHKPTSDQNKKKNMKQKTNSQARVVDLLMGERGEMGGSGWGGRMGMNGRGRGGGSGGVE